MCRNASDWLFWSSVMPSVLLSTNPSAHWWVFYLSPSIYSTEQLLLAVTFTTNPQKLEINPFHSSQQNCDVELWNRHFLRRRLQGFTSCASTVAVLHSCHSLAMEWLHVIRKKKCFWSTVFCKRAQNTKKGCSLQMHDALRVVKTSTGRFSPLETRAVKNTAVVSQF